MATPQGLDEPPVGTRDALEQEIRQLLSDARVLAAWRRYFRSHPWFFCGAAAALGFVVVPRRGQTRRRRAAGGTAAESPIAGADQAEVASGQFAKELLALTAATIAEQSAAQLFELGRQALARHAKSEPAPVASTAASPEPPTAEANSQPHEEVPQARAMDDRPGANGKPPESAAAARIEERVEETIIEHPAPALIAAAAAGLLLGWATKR